MASSFIPNIMHSSYSYLFFPVHFTFGGYVRKQINNSVHVVEIWYLRDNYNSNTFSVYFSRFILSNSADINELLCIQDKLDNFIRTELSDFHIKWMLEFLNNRYTSYKKV